MIAPTCSYTWVPMRMFLPHDSLEASTVLAGGLTEEEIAAFQAKAQAAQFTRGIHRLNYGKQP